MKWFVSRRVYVAWLLLTAIVCGAVVIVWKVAVLDGPPGNVLFISREEVGGEEGPSATITPLGTSADGKWPGSGVRAGEGANSATSVPGGGGATVAAGRESQVEGSGGTSDGWGTTIEVYVSGEVARPGVYVLPEGSRVNDAVAAAGGTLPDADVEKTNLAERVADEEQITIGKIGAAGPQQEDSAAPTIVAQIVPASTAEKSTPTASLDQTEGQPSPTASGTGGAKPTPAHKININTATEEELQLIPGIGPATAQRIVADRQKNGPFKTIDDLTRISGIKEGTLSKIRDYITTGP